MLREGEAERRKLPAENAGQFCFQERIIGDALFGFLLAVFVDIGPIDQVLFRRQNPRPMAVVTANPSGSTRAETSSRWARAYSVNASQGVAAPRRCD
jgi:hypothetical protein